MPILTPERLAQGGWTDAPLPLTPAQAAELQRGGVRLTFDDIPEEERGAYETAETGDVVETVHGYTYYAETPGDLARPCLAYAAVQVDGYEYAVIGQHAEISGQYLPELARLGRLYLISEREYLRLGGGRGATPRSYLLSETGHGHADPYRDYARRAATTPPTADQGPSAVTAAVLPQAPLPGPWVTAS
jgi:hypothetical protein